MGIKVYIENEVSVLALNGDVDMQEVVDIKNTISNVMHDGHYQLVLDLAKVQHINSTGIGILTESLKRLRASNGDLRLSQMNPYLHNIFEITGMSRHFRIYKKCDDAVQSYKHLNSAAA